MNDVYVEMLIDARNKQDLSTAVMVEGLYTTDMFYLVEQGRRQLDRITAKHLLERVGVDNGNYEHYLDYLDYYEWRLRMAIINAIEDNLLDEAVRLLIEYKTYDDCKTNDIRNRIKKQFILFMEIQITKHRCGECSDISMYEETLKLTVPNADKKPLDCLLLSPIEFVLMAEYRRIKYAPISVAINDALQEYEEYFDYIKKSPLGKISCVKVFPKLVVIMYKDIKDRLKSEEGADNRYIYEKMYEYCEEALRQIKERKMLFYLVELLEIRLELMIGLGENNAYYKEKLEESISETNVQLDELRKLYEEYNVSAYMTDDCYLYRESGVYCINEVIKTRRKMMGLTREQLCGDDVDVSTLWRIENKKKPVNRRTVHILFERLNLFPSCVNVGIITDKKHVVELYEELRYAVVTSEQHKVTELIKRLRDILPEHPINHQIIMRTESLNKLRLGQKSKEEHIETLKWALECTVKLCDIERAESIFITTEELTVLYLISTICKETGDYDHALTYIDKIHNYINGIEGEKLIDGRIGIYELVMSYIASLYGDIGKYKESNDISDKLIKQCIKLRRGNPVHSNLYSIAWNNDNAKISGYDYNAQVQRCINISQLLGDTNDEKFYRENLKSTE